MNGVEGRKEGRGTDWVRLDAKKWSVKGGSAFSSYNYSVEKGGVNVLYACNASVRWNEWLSSGRMT